MARAMEQQAALLFRRLRLHEPHVWPDNGPVARNAPPLRPEEFAPPHVHPELSRGRIVRRRQALGKAGFLLTSVYVQEISSAGPVTQDDNVRVSAILVEHPPVNPALAYRFDFKDRSIAFSDDTAPLEAVAEMAKGADVLVHETMYVPAVETYIRGMIAQGRPVNFEAFMAHMNADHTPSEDVGLIAQKAGVKTLVLSHLTPAIDSIDDETWRAPVAKYSRARSSSARI